MSVERTSRPTVGGGIGGKWRPATFLRTLGKAQSREPSALPGLPSVSPPRLSPMSDEAGLPKATVNKVIKDCLPPDLKIASEVRDIVADASLGTITSYSSHTRSFIRTSPIDCTYPKGSPQQAHPSPWQGAQLSPLFYTAHWQFVCDLLTLLTSCTDF